VRRNDQNSNSQVSEYSVNPPEQSSLTKSNVSIDVKVLKPSETYNFPELFKLTDNKLIIILPIVA